MDLNPAEMYQAEQDWNAARRNLLYQEVVCLIKQCSVDLLSFREVQADLNVRQKIARGLQEIPLAAIRGSVGRYDDFSSNFLPRKKHMRDRWERVDVAMKQGKTPPIDVYQVGEIYYVLDGNHRVSVAKKQGLKTIEAYVTEFKAPLKSGQEVDIDELLIDSEQAAFIKRIGRSNDPIGVEINFTCATCYDDLSQQIEIYREGLAEQQGQPVSFEAAFPHWYKEVYLPAIEAIRANDLLARFPERTAADLFIWAWRNNQTLEELAVQDEDAGSSR